MCRMGWHGRGSSKIFPGGCCITMSAKATLCGASVQRHSQMVLTWPPLPFQSILLGFSYSLAIFHSPLGHSAAWGGGMHHHFLSWVNDISKGKGTWWSLQHLCICLWHFWNKGMFTQPPTHWLFGKRWVPDPMHGRGEREITPAAEEFPLLFSV